jgi:hypothetical protein
MCDRLIEDIVGVTESLMVADLVDIEAYAHPDAKLTLNEKMTRSDKGVHGNVGVAKKDKAAELKAKMEEHKAGEGVFKRGSC